MERGDGPGFQGAPRDRRRTPLSFASCPAAAPAKCAACCRCSAQALLLLKEKYPDLRIVIPVVDAVANTVEDITRDWPLSEVLIIDMAERFDAFAAADAAMAKSGTVTLELALAKVPMVVAYRISPTSAFLVRRMGVSVEHASLRELARGAPGGAGVPAGGLHAGEIGRCRR